jgi:hypothetical protein
MIRRSWNQGLILQQGRMLMIFDFAEGSGIYRTGQSWDLGAKA